MLWFFAVKRENGRKNTPNILKKVVKNKGFNNFDHIFWHFFWWYIYFYKISIFFSHTCPVKVLASKTTFPRWYYASHMFKWNYYDCFHAWLPAHERHQYPLLYLLRIDKTGRQWKPRFLCKYPAECKSFQWFYYQPRGNTYFIFCRD